MILHYNNIELEVRESDDSFRYSSLMGENYLLLKFQLIEYVDIPVGAWCEFKAIKYTLGAPANLKKLGEKIYEYTLMMQSSQSDLAKYKFRNSVDKRLKWIMNAKPHEFLEEIVANLNMRESGWSVGSCIEASEKTIAFNHLSIDDALQAIANAFETEWEISNKVIHLRKVEYNKSDPLPLSYGKGNGFVPGVGRISELDKKPIDILFTQGGERNIDRSKYGTAELLLPKAQTLTYENRVYVSDEHGYSIQRSDRPLRYNTEGSLDCTDIYPKRVGSVSEVEIINEEKNLYDIIDTSIPENLNFNDLIIEGETPTVIFQTGMLAGKEFEFQYKHDERRFELVPQDIDGYIMPGDVYVPQVNDTYAVYGIMLPDAYISDNATKIGASWDMFREAARCLFENEEQKFTFIGELQGLWAKENWLIIGGKLILGGYINFTDTQFAQEGVLIRITGMKEFLTSPYSPIIELSNSISGKSFTSTIKEIEGEEVINEERTKGVLQYTKRRFRDAKETMSLLENSFLNFDKGINPIFVQTMQLLVGDESLQFRFVNNKTNPTQVSHIINFDAETKILTANSGIIQHMTLGINTIKETHSATEYKFWDISKYDSPVLDQPDKPYYLYAKVSKETNSGTFLLSEAPIKIESVAGYNHLLVGILNSEFEGERSFVTLYGFTEILPGRITTDKIVSADGKTYFDLVNSIIGGKLRFLSNGIEKDLADWADSILNNLDNTDQTITDLEDYLNEAFRDGLIEEAEAKAIETYINQIQSEKAGVEATYNKLYVNPILKGDAKTYLLHSKVSYFGAVDNLTSSINAVIADGRVTTSEKQSINAIFNTYKSSLATFSTRIEEAKQFVEQAIKSVADDAKSTANAASSAVAAVTNSVNNISNTVNNLDSYIDNAFRDGVIEEVEAKVIESYINQILAEKASLEATYNKLYINPFLEDTTTKFPKSNLLHAKISFFGAVDDLVNSINAVIADGKVTPNEKQSINAIFGTYRDALASFATRIEEANIAIQTKINDNIGAVNASINVIKAITDKFGTTIDGGLISTVTMLLREFNSTAETAGISGLQGSLKDNPAFWAGGEYEEAFRLISFLSAMSKETPAGTGANQYNYSAQYPQLAKITMLHNGAAKIGDFIIEESGRIVMVDPTTGIARLVFSTENLPSIDDLIAGTSSTGSVNIGSGSTSTSITLSGSANVTQTDGTMTIGAMSITVSGSGRSDLRGMSSFIDAKLVLYRGSTMVRTICSSSLFFTGDNYHHDSETRDFNQHTFNISGKGIYTFKLEVSRLGDISSASGSSTSFSLAWNASLSGVKRQQYGLDGMMFYYSFLHFYYTESKGLDIRGKTNMPGVLASGTVSTGGVLSNEWGAKINYGQTITGGYRIFLKDMTHNKYSVQITPHTNVTFRVSTKTNTYFEILGTGAADFVVFGSNY